jgi:hypothetical protein
MREEQVGAAVTVEIKPSERPFPGFWQAVLLVVIVSILQAFLSLPFVIVGLFRHPAALAIPILAATAAVVAVGFKITRATFGEVFPFAAVRWQFLCALLLVIAGLFVLRLEIAKIMNWALPPPGWFSQFMKVMIGANRNPWGGFVAGAIVIPFAEEILYRGLILYGFLKRFGARKAIALSAFLFALMHGNPWQFVPALLIAVVLAWCLVRTGSLIPCLFGHMANNAIAYILAGLKVNLPGGTGLHPLWFDTAALLCACLGLWLLLRDQRARLKLARPIDAGAK